jgi:hypothetical protein
MNNPDGSANPRQAKAEVLRRRITEAAGRTTASLPELQENIAAFRQDVQTALRTYSTDLARTRHKREQEFYDYWIEYGRQEEERRRDDRSL